MLPYANSPSDTFLPTANWHPAAGHYRRGWPVRFARRRWVGRTLQRLFGHRLLSERTLRTFGTFWLRVLMRQTYGEVLAV